MSREDLPGFVFQGIEEYITDLDAEIGPSDAEWGPFRYLHDPASNPRFSSPATTAVPHAWWARNTWLEPFRIEFDSISEAAKALREVQRNWAPCLFTQFRRGELIKERLPPISAKPKPFPFELPTSPMGAWTLLDEHTMLASATCSSPFPGGIVEFEEDKVNPPSRAYLKLREALVQARRFPGPGETCVDAGASPGGWSWVLAGLGARVLAVDRAELEPRIAAMPGVEYRRHDAFTLKPEEFGRQDWVCSDVICYPQRLYEWISLWLASGLCEKFICTIKIQGEPDLAAIRLFDSIPGGSVVHLHNNKHELTWIRV